MGTVIVCVLLSDDKQGQLMRFQRSITNSTNMKCVLLLVAFVYSSTVSWQHQTLCHHEVQPIIEHLHQFYLTTRQFVSKQHSPKVLGAGQLVH